MPRCESAWKPSCSQEAIQKRLSGKSNFWHSGLSEGLVYSPAAWHRSWDAASPVSPRVLICTSLWGLLPILYPCGLLLNLSTREHLGRIVCHHHFRFPVIRVQVTIQRHSRAFTYTQRPRVSHLVQLIKNDGTSIGYLVHQSSLSFSI